MNTNIISGALKTINEARLSALIQKASAFVVQIEGKRKSLACVNKNIENLQKELVDLSTSIIDATYVMGAPLPDATLQNENQKTLAVIFDRMNKAKQDCVGEKANRLAQGITNEQSAAAALQKQIDELVAELNKIEEEPVTTGQIVG